jgi:hypothetical protein
VSVTTFPLDTVQLSHGAGLGGQLTGPNRPSPLFEIAMVFVMGALVPRTARKSTDGWDNTISMPGSTASEQAVVATSVRLATNADKW